eukprot:2440918-Prymnesium_polylepis.1
MRKSELRSFIWRTEADALLTARESMCFGLRRHPRLVPPGNMAYELVGRSAPLSLKPSPNLHLDPDGAPAAAKMWPYPAA